MGILALLVSTLCGPDVAVGQGLTGSIEGRITDNSGAVLPGVTVTLSGASVLGGTQVRVSEGDGRFRLPVLPPGTYTVTFELPGFQRVERANLPLAAGQTITLDQVLGPASVTETLTVSGEAPTVDIRSTTVAHVVDTATIDQIPVARRFTDLLNTMPGVQNGLYTFSPVNAVYGSKVTDNVYAVDGINFVDPNVSSAVTDVAYDDIAEVQVSTSGQSAEFGSASGGVFNFITKSGSNVFRGLLSGYMQTKGLSANNISDELAAIGIRPTVFDHQYDYGGNIGGPVLRDRMFFFGSYYRFDQEQSISDFPVPIPTTQWQGTVKIDAQVNATNRFNGYFNYRNRTWSPFNFGFTTAADPRTWIGIQWKNPLSTIGWTATPGSKTVIQARFGFALFDLVNFEPNVEKGTPVYVENVTGVVTGGPNGSFNGVQNRDRYAFKADVSRFVERFLGGSLDMKAGFENEWLSTNNKRGDQAYAEGILHQMQGGAPFRVQLRNWEAQRRANIGHWSAYLQNQWQATSRLTINAGLRADNWAGSLGPDELFGNRFFPAETIPKADGLVDFLNIAPRLGAAFDVLGNRKIAVKGSWGRFYQRVDSSVLSVAERGAYGVVTRAWLDCRTPAGAPVTCQTAGALPGDGVFRGDMTELGAVVSDSRPVSFGRVGEDLKMPYSDSFNAGVEIDLGRGFGGEVNFIYKRERDIWSRVNLAWFDPSRADPFSLGYDAYNVKNPLDGAPLTIYSLKPALSALPPQNLLTNPEDPTLLYRNYQGLELVLRRRLLDGWMMSASYNLGRSEGSSGTLFFDHQGSPYLNPNSLINIAGDQQLDRRHILKLNGMYQLKYGINVSSMLQYLSGVPWYTTGSGGSGVTGATYVRFNRGVDYPATSNDPFIRVPGEPQGAKRFDAEVYWDARLERRTQIRKANVDVMVDVFNLLNRNTVVRVQTLNQDLANYLRPAQILSPRAARLAVRMTF